jgi:membrane associated rhomboid family serine protease
MPLENRSYMQDPLYGSRKSITVVLLVALAICFVLQSIAFSYSPNGGYFIIRYLFLTRDALVHGYIWQLLTFQFLHGGFIHILLNGLVLFFIGKALETTLPTRDWLQIYFGAGTVGGLFHILGNLALPFNFPAPVVGASAGVSGLLGAFCFLYPANVISLWGIINFPARFFFILSVSLSLFFILVPAAGLGVAHGAHLGGILFGYGYARWLLHQQWKMPDLLAPFRRRPKIFIHKTQSSTWTAAQKQNETELPSEEFISKEVDPILDKISAHGIQSLTERERRILEAARAKMARR